MFVSFETIHESSRVWVYTSTRKFSLSEMTFIEEQLVDFTKNWTSHNHNLETSFTICYNQIIVLAVNENINDASGCSIDKSVQVIKLISEKLAIDLLDKTTILYFKNNELNTAKLTDLKSLVLNDYMTADTLVINTLVETKNQFKTSFVLPASETWLKRYFKKVA